MSAANLPKWEIYLITNLVSGRRYVGITKRGVAIRWRNHISDARKRRSNSPLHSAIRKYGPAGFAIEVLSTFDNRAAAILAEKREIIAHNSLVPTGYNITPGGDGHEGPHKPFTPKTIEKMRQAKLGRSLSPDHRAKIGRKGRKQTPEWISKRSIATAAKMRGRKHTPEQRRRRSESLRGRIVTEATKIKIGNANRGKKHPAAAAAVRERLTGVPLQRTTNAASGLRGAYRSGSTWFSHIMVRRKRTYLGSFKTAEEAHAAYCAAALAAFGDAARLD